MGQCTRCQKKRFLRSFPERYDVPELRAMVSHWPWHRVQVCDECEPQFREEFSTRLRLLAPQAVAQSADVTARVCLMCGEQGEDVSYIDTGRWVDASGEAVAGRFKVCEHCAGSLMAGGIVSAAELTSTGDFRHVFERLPQVTDATIRQGEGWSLSGNDRPVGTIELHRDISLEAAGNLALGFWIEAPPQVRDAAEPLVRGATIKPDDAGAIRTHLELCWQSRGDEGTPPPADATTRVTLSVYRHGGGYTVVMRDETI